MNKIVIIGNGFDLAHDLKTSYCDFIEKCIKDNPIFLNNSKSELFTKIYEIKKAKN